MRDVSFGLSLRHLLLALTVILVALSAAVGSGALRTLGSVDAARRADVSRGEISPAYLYGYTSAALTACPLEEGPAWEAFERALAEQGQSAENGFLAEVSEGFATFDRDANAHGHSTVCDQALNLYGTRDSDHGLLLSNSIVDGEAIAPSRGGY